MASESDEMDFASGHVMQKTINDFFEGNAVAYVQALWNWIETVPEVWEPLSEFKLTEGYMLARNSINPKGLSYAKSKETFPNSWTLVSQFYLYTQVSHDLPRVKAPMIVELMDMNNSRRFWRIIRTEEASEDPLEVKLERYYEKKLRADWSSESLDEKKLKDITEGLAYKYLFLATFLKIHIEYEMKGRTEHLEFLMEKYGLLGEQ